MITRDLSLEETDLQAFVDGHLSPESRRAVIAHLAGEAVDAERVASYREINEELHRLFDDVLYEPLPARLQIGRLLARRSWLARLRSWFEVDVTVWAPRFAALALIVALSGAGGWWLKGQGAVGEVEAPGAAFVRQAAYAHKIYAPDPRHPWELGADQRESLLGWLTERLGQQVHAPDLGSLEFDLVGGRLLPSAGQPAAQLMYEDEGGRRITLYLRGRWSVSESSPLSNAQEGNVRFVSEGGISLVYWMEGPFAYALIGEMDRDQLFTAARTIQEELQAAGVPVTVPDEVAQKEAT